MTDGAERKDVGALEDQQRILALLYTDAAFRERFANNAPNAPHQFGVSERTATALLATAKHEIELFADSLFRKRFGAFRKLAPRTTAALGDQAAPLFRRFVNDVPGHPPTYIHDVGRFAAWLNRADPIFAQRPWIIDLARYESSGAIAYYTAPPVHGIAHVLPMQLFRIRWLLLQNDIRPALRPETDLRVYAPNRARLLCVWIRTGRRVHEYHFAFAHAPAG